MDLETKLIKVVEAGNADEVRELIAQGANVNHKHEWSNGYSNITVLMVAAEKGHTEILRQLLASGADVKAKDRFIMPGEGGGDTALHYAIHHHQLESVNLLVAAGANLEVAATGQTPLAAAMAKFDVEIVRALLSAGAKPKGFPDVYSNVSEETYLKGISITKLLLEAGANPNAYGQFSYDTPLHPAAAFGRIEMVNVLLKGGADPNFPMKGDGKEGRTPLELAATGGLIHYIDWSNEEEVAKWVNHPRASGSCVQTGKNAVGIVRLLIEAGAKVNHRNADGWTALMYALRAKRDDTVTVLRELGADNQGCAMIEIVLGIENGQPIDGIRKLLENVPVGDVRAGNGSSIWELAVSNKRWDLIKVLLELGHDVNGVQIHGNPLLKSAIGNMDWLRLLIGYGADLNIKDSTGRGPLQWVRGRPEATKIIKEALAAQDKPKVMEAESSVAPPDFGALSAKPAFVELAQSIGRSCGQAPKPLAVDGNGGFAFELEAAQLRALLAAQFQPVLRQGAYLFECQHEKCLGLLPTNDRYQVIAFMQTNGANYDLDTEDIVTKARELEKMQPYELTGIGHDFLSGRFLTPIKNSRKLAQWLYKFCPDMVDQGAGTVANAAKILSETQTFFLWWD